MKLNNDPLTTPPREPEDPFDNQEIASISNHLGSVDFRHLSAFKKVYLERNYANAGISLAIHRKGIVRMMQTLERILECPLFQEDAHGDLIPTAFAERLFNDLRFLHSAQCRLKDHISNIHETGRVLHIGSSPSVFRTTTFRTLFRELQSVRGVRLSYTAIPYEDASKALLSGQCDLFIGPWTGQAKRYMTLQAGKISFRLFSRMPLDGPIPMSIDRYKAIYIVQLDGVSPTLRDFPGYDKKWLPLSEKQWLRWQDYPKECSEDTLICAPDTAADSYFWQSCEASWVGASQLEIHASFLRQHPYEFLPTLAGKIKAHAAKS